MKTRWLALAACVTACAATETHPGESTPDESRVPAPEDGGLDDGAADAGTDTGPCADCEYFPETCTADAFCSNGPFNPGTAGGPLDTRVTISVIQGRAADDVWVAGALGAVAHFDGTSWSTSALGGKDALRALWLRDGEEVVLSSFPRAYARSFDRPDSGATPSPGGWVFTVPTLAAGASSAKLTSAWAAPRASWLWCTATVFSGSTPGLWRMRREVDGTLAVQAGTTHGACGAHCNVMTSIHGVSAEELWAVGESGAAVRIEGADGDEPSVKPFNTQTLKALHGVWVASMTNVWAVGAGGTIRHYTGDPSLWDVVSDVPTTENLRAIAGSSPSDIWAVGDGAVVLHYDGTRWSRVKLAGLGHHRPDLTAVWVAEQGRIWIGGHGVLLSLGGK